MLKLKLINLNNKIVKNTVVKMMILAEILLKHLHKICFIKIHKIKTIPIQCWKKLLNIQNKNQMEKIKKKAIILNQWRKLVRVDRKIKIYKRPLLNLTKIFCNNIEIRLIRVLNLTIKQLRTENWCRRLKITTYHLKIHNHKDKKIKDPILKLFWMSKY